MIFSRSLYDGSWSSIQQLPSTGPLSSHHLPPLLSSFKGKKKETSGSMSVLLIVPLSPGICLAQSWQAITNCKMDVCSSYHKPFVTRVQKNVPIHSIDCYDTVLGTVTGNMLVIKMGTLSSRSFQSRVNEAQWQQNLMNHELERTADATKQLRGDPNP